MSRTAYLPQLVFSTRARHPRGGGDFVREIVAATPGIDEMVRGDFYRRADLVGRVLQAELEEPIYTFSPAPGEDPPRWLFARTVSIGWYRKGHQLLTHGLLVERWHLEALQGNPFLLKRDRGAPFRGDHPGAQTELPQLAVELPAGTVARENNLGRLERLSRELSGRDRDLPALLEGLARGEPVLYVVARPRPEFAEWLLLHFHPDDRPELSFHSWYCHGREVRYRLPLVIPDVLREVRSQFRSASTVEEGQTDAGGALGLGELALRLRRASPEFYARTLRRYRLTYLAKSGEHDPLPPHEAVPAFKEALKLPLTNDEKRSLRRKRARGEAEDRLGEAVERLADVWLSRRKDFREEVREEAEGIGPLAPGPLRRAVQRAAAEPPAWGWALLALLAEASPRGPLTTARGRREAWRWLAGRDEWDRLLAFLSDGAAGRLDPRAAGVLTAYVASVALSDRSEDHARLGPPVSALIDSVEDRSDLAASEGADPAAMLSATAEALAWRSRIGLAPPAAERLGRWLEAVATRLGAEAAEAAGELIGACCAAGDPELAASVLAHLRRAAENDRETVLAVVLAEAAARLTPALAAAPAGSELLQLVAGLAQLVLAAEGDELPHSRLVARDAVLAAACLPAMAGAHALEDLADLGAPISVRALAQLRGAWLCLLSRAYRSGSAVEVLADPRWLDVLEDDLRQHPIDSGDRQANPDPRRPLLLHLAWHHWGMAARSSPCDIVGRETGRLLRLAPGNEVAHRQAIRAMLPEHLHEPAEELLFPFRSVTGNRATEAWSPG